MNLFFGLIASSVVGSILFFSLLLLRLFTNKLFSKTWHYYSLLVPLIFLLGGTYIVGSLTGLISYHTPNNISPTHAASHLIPAMPLNMAPPLNSIPATEGAVLSESMPEREVYAASAVTISNQIMELIERIMPFLLTVWALGAVLFMFISAKTYLKYRRFVLHNANAVISIDCPIPIVVSNTAHTPMLIGLLRPVIALPDVDLSEEELEVILTHEMVHYRRKDLWLKSVALFANAVHWFNPTVYIFCRQLSIICELSCDEKVVLKMPPQSRKFYGETILQILQYSTEREDLLGNVAFATNLCNSYNNTKRRLISMMKAKKMKKTAAALAVTTGILVISVGLVASHLIRPSIPAQAAAPEPTQETSVAEVYETSVYTPENVSIHIYENPAVQTDESDLDITDDVASLNRWDIFHSTVPYQYDSLPHITYEESEIATLAAQHRVDNILLPTHIPAGFNFAKAEFTGATPYTFRTTTTMSESDIWEILSQGNFIAASKQLEDGSNAVIVHGSFNINFFEFNETHLPEGFEWEKIGLPQCFNTFLIYYTHENNFLTTLTVWIKHYGGWGWDNPETVWRYESEITVNGMSGFMSEGQLRLLDVDNSVSYVFVGAGGVLTQDDLIRIAESLR